MKNNKARNIGVMVVVVAVSGIAVWFASKLNVLKGTTPQWLTISEEPDQQPSTVRPQAIEVVGLSVTMASGPTGLLRPSRRIQWVFYLNTAEKRERIWGIDHLQFDFMGCHDDPLHILATQLENGVLTAVYKEHGETRASIVKKDDNPPRGTGQWLLTATRSLFEDGDGGNPRVIGAKILGSVSGQNMRLQLSIAGEDAVVTESVFTLRWWAGKPQWTPYADARK
jgi:hypothetical protein